MKAKVQRWVLVFSAVCVLQAALIATESDAGQSIVAEPKMQNQIDRTIGIIMKHWEGRASEADVLESINTLESINANKLQIVPQLILARSGATGQEKRLSALIIIEDQIMKRLDPSDVVNSVVPYMEVTNLSVRAEVRETLDNLRARNGRTCTFAVFSTYLRQHGRSASIPLVKYMLRANPDEAMKAMQRALVGEDYPAEADITTQPLQSLVASGHWWEEA